MKGVDYVTRCVGSLGGANDCVDMEGGNGVDGHWPLCAVVEILLWTL